MSLQIDNFKKPAEHPYGMLQGYRKACEKEGSLAYFLSCCIEAGEWISVKSKYVQTPMVEDGLLKDEGDGNYSLTNKAKGLLSAYYYKED